MYYKKLSGERIYLSPMDLNHETDIMTKWMNEDQEIAYGNAFYDRLIGKEKTIELLNKWNEGPFAFSIVSLKDDTFLGNISLFNMSNHELFATMGIYIGAPYRQHGYGKEAIALLIKYIFQTQRYQAIHLEVFDFNKHALETYKKCGFTECGRWHKAFYHLGEYHDIILMELCKDDLPSR